MSVVDRITQLRSESALLLSPQEAFTRSGIEDTLEELSQVVPLSTTQETNMSGKRLSVVVRWPVEGDDQRFNQFVISIKGNTIAFIGDQNTDQHLKLEGNERFDKEMVERFLARTFLNPSVVNTKNTEETSMGEGSYFYRYLQNPLYTRG